MTFAAPLGFLGLLSIAGLILIYILKPKYQDKKVASTYIWKLSLKYAKRKIPWQWLRGSLLLFIQILIFALLAFMLSRPGIVFASSQTEKIVILDASASMAAEEDRASPFTRAKGEIASLADATIGSDNKFTLIIAADEASFAARRTDSAGFVRQKLSETDFTLKEPDIAGAIELAESVLGENPEAEVHLYTDHGYEDSGRVTVHDMSANEWNAAVVNVTAKRSGGKYTFTAEIASYGRAAEFSVGLSLDGKAQVPKIALCEENGTANVVWEVRTDGYEIAKVTLQGVADAFAYDNEFTHVGTAADLFKVQLVSGDPGFLQRGLLAAGLSDITLVNENTPAQTSGFDLYVYDGALPEERPADGAVWLIDPPYEEAESVLASEWGLSFSGRNKGEFSLSAQGGASSETYNAIMRNVSLAKVLVTEYAEIASHDGYESIVLCNESPVLLTKNDNGLKTVVLGFDIHKSDIAIDPYFPLLVKNICNYAIATVPGTLYTVGDTVRVQARPDALSVTLHAEHTDGTGEELQLSPPSADVETHLPGLYTVTQTLASGKTVVDRFFVRVKESESALGEIEKTLKNPVVFTEGAENVRRAKDTKDIFVYLAAAMLVIVCIEWGLQYREQF